MKSQDPAILLEKIGKKILDNWGNDYILDDEENAISKLQELLKTHPNEMDNKWDNEMENIIKRLSPFDFAIYGKDISVCLMRKQSQSNKFSQCVFNNPKRTKNEPYFPKWLPTIF